MTVSISSLSLIQAPATDLADILVKGTYYHLSCAQLIHPGHQSQWTPVQVNPLCSVTTMNASPWDPGSEEEVPHPLQSPEL